MRLYTLTLTYIVKPLRVKKRYIRIKFNYYKLYKTMQFKSFTVEKLEAKAASSKRIK